MVVHQGDATKHRTRSPRTRSRDGRVDPADQSPYPAPIVRIVSLVPSATEMLFALGWATRLPPSRTSATTRPEALDLPKVTRDVIGPGLAPDEIDRAVRELTEQGKRDLRARRARAARARAGPDRHPGAVRGLRGLLRRRAAIAERMEPGAGVISLDPHTLGEVLGDVRTLAQATDAKDAGVDLVQDAAARIDRVRLAVRARGAGRGGRARVARPRSTSPATGRRS